MKVPFEQFSVQLDSYPGGECWQRHPSKPWGNLSISDGLATQRAATRVNPEQAPKCKSRKPTRSPNGEGRCALMNQPEAIRAFRRGVGGSALGKTLAQRGKSARMEGRASTRCPGQRSVRMAERAVVPSKSGNADGGKGPRFWVLSKEPRVRRLV